MTFGFDWEDYTSWLEEAIQKATAGRDWLVVDRVDKGWNRVQNYFSEEVYGKEEHERLLDARKQAAGKKAMVVTANDQADWMTIDRQYQHWFLRLMYKSRCHIYMAAAAAPVRSSDDGQVRDLYGPLGVRPEGQKALPYEPYTVLYLNATKQRQWTMTTVKDRGRQYFDKQPLVSLPHQYLLATAHWSLHGAS